MAIFTDRWLCWADEGAAASASAELTDELPRFVAHPAKVNVTAASPIPDNVPPAAQRTRCDPRKALNFAAAAFIMCSFFARGSVNSETAPNRIGQKR